MIRLTSGDYDKIPDTFSDVEKFILNALLDKNIQQRK